MTSPTKKFIVLFQIPSAVMDNWMQTPAEVRAPAEQKLRGEWGVWTEAHAGLVTGSEAAGKTTRVTAAGSADARNDIILYAFAEAESLEAAAKAFETHPHLQIPEASIEVMEVRPM